jgi:hypothetical protein
MPDANDEIHNAASPHPNHFALKAKETPEKQQQTASKKTRGRRDKEMQRSRQKKGGTC